MGGGNMNMTNMNGGIIGVSVSNFEIKLMMRKLGKIVDNATRFVGRFDERTTGNDANFENGMI